MLRSIRNTIVMLLSVATLLALPMVVPAVATADPSITDCVKQGSKFVTPTGEDCPHNDLDSSNSAIDRLIKAVINTFSWIVGVVAVIMIIVGGFRYVTAGGDSNNVTAAKNTIIYAIIGLVVVAMAQFIVQFVLNKVAS